MRVNWITKKFEDCLQKTVYTNKIQRKDFLENGVFPIISQENEFINGYWNDKKDVLKVTNPIVIFGDHTQVLKYVDFDFVLGADGVKILNPRGFLEPKFFYYFLQNINLRGLGYARHYRLLKEKNVSYPESLREQKRVISILDKSFVAIEKAKENAEKNLQNAHELFESQLQFFFKQRNGWIEKRLDDLYQIGSSRRVLKSQWKSKGIPFYRGREITRLAKDGHVDNQLFISEEHYSELAQKSGIPKVGDILITAIGTIGNTYIVRQNDRLYFKDASVLWMKKSSDANSEFIKYWLMSPMFFEQLDKGNGATVDTLTIQKLQKIKLFVPIPEEQKNIVIKLNAILHQSQKLKEVYQQKIFVLDELKKSLLNEAFSGNL